MSTLSSSVRLAELAETGFVTQQASSDIVFTTGYSDMKKSFRLLKAVETQVATNPVLFHTFVTILSSEPALIAFAKLITKSHGRCIDIIHTVVLMSKGVEHGFMHCCFVCYIVRRP